MHALKWSNDQQLQVAAGAPNRHELLQVAINAEFTAASPKMSAPAGAKRSNPRVDYRIVLQMIKCLGRRIYLVSESRSGKSGDFGDVVTEPGRLLR